MNTIIQQETLPNATNIFDVGMFCECDPWTGP